MFKNTLKNVFLNADKYSPGTCEIGGIMLY